MKRWGVIVLVVVLLFLGAGVLGFRVAVRMLKDRVTAALGPGSEVAELKVGWNSIELVGLDIRAPIRMADGPDPSSRARADSPEPSQSYDGSDQDLFNHRQKTIPLRVANAGEVRHRS